jgi:hypothetical protein
MTLLREFMMSNAAEARHDPANAVLAQDYLVHFFHLVHVNPR